MDTNPKKVRTTSKGDAWGVQGCYAKSGKSTDTPTGQSNLVVPTEEVLAWIKEHPPSDLKSTVMLFDVDYDLTPPGQRTGGRRSFTYERTRQIVMERMSKGTKDEG
jgi:hypothetical protein